MEHRRRGASFTQIAERFGINRDSAWTIAKTQEAKDAYITSSLTPDFHKRVQEIASTFGITDNIKALEKILITNPFLMNFDLEKAKANIKHLSKELNIPEDKLTNI